MKITYRLLIALLLILTANAGCMKEKEEKSGEKITLLGRYDIPVPEPSGLALTRDQNGFWTVSDEDSYLYELDKYGKIIKRIKVDGVDLEGVTVIDEATLAIVLERTREVVVLDTSGTELQRVKINLGGEPNSGLEGITYNEGTKHFYVVTEKDPAFIIELDGDLNEVRRDTIKFAADVSGIFYDENDNVLWILSDEDKMVVKTDLELNIISKLKISTIQPEGIT
ncbi:MAG: SdiA-regulated domain-containing protein, partial [Ignavibacteria bacterium]|nr:SdiA-regulated domain-containing protein [Ignavibacteria bacterium]